MDQVVRKTALAAPVENEKFSFGRLTFDVKQAHDLIQLGKIKAPIEKIPAKDVILGMSIPVKSDKPMTNATQGMPMFVSINWDHAGKLTDDDLARPGIIAETKAGHLLIDGNHRMVAAYHKDADAQMPVFVIAKKYVGRITPGTAAYLKAKQAIRKSLPAKAEAAPDIQGDVEGKFTLGPIQYDQKHGIGNVPDNANLKYKGFAVLMKPSQFLALAPGIDTNLDGTNNSLKYLKAQMRKDKAIGSPFLDVAAGEKGKPAEVLRHEGRHRMTTIMQMHGDIPVLVHIFVQSPANETRARFVTDAMIADFQKRLLRQLTNTEKRAKRKPKRTPIGPNFDRRVWHLTGWKTVGDPPPQEAALARIITCFSSTDSMSISYKKNVLDRLKDSVSTSDYFRTRIIKIDEISSFVNTLEK